VAVTDQQKLDFLLKKIGYTKTKTGSVVGTGAISGTPKQPFAEAIPSPLIIANSALWNESGSIPTTPPGSDTSQVKVYLAGTSGLRMTADSTSSGQRAYIAYSTYGNASSTRLTNWIDTQFGSAYLIKVYKGDPNSGGVALSAAGSGSNDGWFFDYSAGTLNFNDTSVPSGVTDTNIYIVGYRYIGSTGAPTPSGGGNFTYNDLVVSRNFQVAGLSTFNGLVDINAGGQANTFKVEDLTDNRIVIAGTGGELEDSANLTFDGSTLGVTGDATFSGNVSIGGTLTYEDVVNVDSVGIVTARAGINVTGGVITALAGENKIPSLYAAMGNLPSAGSYHGMFAHVHATARGYFAHAGNWYELVNKEVNGVVGTGTERYNIGPVDLTTLDVSGISTFAGDVDINGDLDVDGHTNLDNVSVAGVTTFASSIHVADSIIHQGDTDTKIDFDNNRIKLTAANKLYADIGLAGYNYFYTATNFVANSSSPKPSTYVARFRDEEGDDLEVQFFNTNVKNAILTWNDTGNTNAAGNLVFKSVAGGSGLEHARFTGSGNFNLLRDLDVDGHTNLDNVSIAGFTTITQDLDVDGHTNLDNVSIAGVTTMSGALNANGNIVITSATPYITFDDTNNRNWQLNADGGNFIIKDTTDSVNRFYINSTGNAFFSNDLDVDGHTNLDNVSVAGVTTFAANTRFNSSITAGGGTGSNGQYLKTTGSGVEWATFPSLRTSQTFTASAGQTTFSFSYTVGLVDVFVNGVKLTTSEFTATNGTSVVLAVGSFVGDIVELNNYNTVSAGGGAGGISNLVEDTTPQLGGNLDLFNKSITGTGNVNITGIISATSFKGPSGVTATFVGDGSGLTGITASGTGIIIKHDNNSVGTAGTINFGTGLDVSAISGSSVTVGVTTSQLDINKLDVSGISTFKGAVDINADLDVDGHTNLDNVSIAGVVTATTFVGALTGNATGLSGNPSINITDLDVDGHTNLDNISVAGVSTFTGAINASEVSLTGTAGIKANSLNLKNAAGSATYAIFTNGGSALLKHNNTDRLETSASGVTVTGTVAATSYTGDGSNLTGISVGSTAEVRSNTLNVIGVSTFAGALDVNNNVVIDGNIDLNGDIDVEGHTNLDNISVSGVSTFTGTTTFQQLSSFSSALQVGTAVTIASIGNATYTGIVTAQKFVGDGSGLTGVSGSGSGIAVKNSGSVVGTAGTIDFGTGISVTPVSAGIVTVSTATTSITDSYTRVNAVKENATGSSENGIFAVDLGLYTGGGSSSEFDALHYQKTGNDYLFELNKEHNGNNIVHKLSTGNTGGYGEFRVEKGPSGAANVGAFRYAASAGAGQWTLSTGGQQNYLTTQLYNIFPLPIIPQTDSATDIGLTGTRFRAAYVDTYYGDGSNLTGVTGATGITTNLSGSFTASAGSPSTINTFGYGSGDIVVEYTVFIKNGSDFQTQKLLAMRDGTTIHSTQFAVMFSSSLLVQCDATISSGNILLRATPETGVSGSTTYKIKREVM